MVPNLRVSLPDPRAGANKRRGLFDGALMKTINGRKLREMRLSHGLAIWAAGDVSGLCDMSVKNLESGEHMVNTKKFFTYCDAFHINPLDYIG